MKQRADYGLYGSLWSYFTLFGIATMLVLIGLYSEQFRVLSIALLGLDLLVALSLLMLKRGRAKIVHQIVERGGIKAGDRVLDVGTGRGFLAVEIAKRVPDCEVIGIDLWEMPAKGQIHKGFVVGNTKENAERNAELEGVSDRVAFRRCDARQMPLDSGSFDVVVSSAALHQMIYFGKGGYRVLDEILRVLKPDGLFIDADAMMGKGLVEYLKKIGFGKLRIDGAIRIGPIAVVKILSATKSLQ